MENTLASGSVVKHNVKGNGRILSMFDDNGQDMVEILWQCSNTVEDIREDSLRNCLTVATQSAKSLSPWLALLAEEQ